MFFSQVFTTWTISYHREGVCSRAKSPAMQIRYRAKLTLLRKESFIHRSACNKKGRHRCRPCGSMQGDSYFGTTCEAFFAASTSCSCIRPFFPAVLTPVFDQRSAGGVVP
jgi:hypothetical protein